MSAKADAADSQRGLFWAVTYSAISIAITLFNKAVLSTYKFESSMTLTLLQGIVTIVCLEVMRMKGWCVRCAVRRGRGGCAVTGRRAGRAVSRRATHGPTSLWHLARLRACVPDPRRYWLVGWLQGVVPGVQPQDGVEVLLPLSRLHAVRRHLTRRAGTRQRTHVHGAAVRAVPRLPSGGRTGAKDGWEGQAGTDSQHQHCRRGRC